MKCQEWFEIKEKCIFNPDDKFIVCYVGRKNTQEGENTVKFIKCDTVNAVIFTFGHIKIDPDVHPKTKLNGLFIAANMNDQNKVVLTLGKHFFNEVEDEFIPLYEEGKKGLQLMYNSGYDVTTVISDNLPNPGIKNTNTEIYINI